MYEVRVFLVNGPEVVILTTNRDAAVESLRPFWSRVEEVIVRKDGREVCRYERACPVCWSRGNHVDGCPYDSRFRVV